jgi:hypothetical protein
MRTAAAPAYGYAAANQTSPSNLLRFRKDDHSPLEVVDEPVEGRGQDAMYGMLNPSLEVADGPSGVAFIPAAVERLGGDAKLNDEVAAEVFCSASPRFSLQRRISAASSSPMMTRASEPPTNWR